MPCEVSGGLLLSGELPLRFSSANFALRKPSWSLPDYGAVQALLSVESPGLGIVEFPAVWSRERFGGCWVKGAGGTWSRECDLPRKRPVRWFSGKVFTMSFMVLGF